MNTKKRWRKGITTGTCAAAAAKAALLAWRGEFPSQVAVRSPQGVMIAVPVAGASRLAAGGKAYVIKDAGDDPDITHGTEVWAEVEPGGEQIELRGGEGIGRVTQPGLAVPPGQPAINPGPRQMIIDAVKETLDPGQGAIVTISIPAGTTLAKRTLNPMLGIEGGISILGTTGIVEPMSEEAFKHSLVPQIAVAQALGYEQIVFVPGKIGWNAAVDRCGLPGKAVIQTSNFIGYMLEQAAEMKLRSVLLFGHIGKIAKVAAGVFYTHSKIADARMETLAAYSAWLGASTDTVREILALKTAEAAIELIAAKGLDDIYPLLASRASQRAQQHVYGDLTVGTVLTTLNGAILGMDDMAKTIGGELGWTIGSIS
ncbi:MAG: cobalt-precorrin-5B (C(1))-methyltransferase CbiD [Sporomusaceae bacterium]|nr:cobalt-precorrin-5B (C(1))-methyltransferase CbiD [Sporomusaceae bacterium]